MAALLPRHRTAAAGRRRRRHPADGADPAVPRRHHRARRAGRGRAGSSTSRPGTRPGWRAAGPALLFLLVALLATATTVLLGLDTTAVLLTPVVLSLAVQLDLPPMPFALLTVWLANTASLLLPVSNLTNLLALDRLDLTPHEFAARMWLPTVVAGRAHRRCCSGCATAGCSGCGTPCPRRPAVERRGAARRVGAGLPRPRAGAAARRRPDVVVTVAAAALVVVFAVRRRARAAVRAGAVAARGLRARAGARGRDRAAARRRPQVVAPSPATAPDCADLLQVAGVGAVASNLLNNLPAYLVLEPHAAGGGDTRLLALLVGTNVGPMVLLWGSLATLLWRERLPGPRARGVGPAVRRSRAGRRPDRAGRHDAGPHRRRADLTRQLERSHRDWSETPRPSRWLTP